MDKTKMKESETVYFKDFGDSLLIRALGDSPRLRIIDIFLSSPYFDYNKEELARELGLSKQTIYKNFPDLEEQEIVVVSRKVGRAVMYRLNMEHTVVKHLKKLVKELSSEVCDKELALELENKGKVPSSTVARKKTIVTPPTV